eukprot:2231042-Pleurochrysis_carterae.AAC.1
MHSVHARSVARKWGGRGPHTAWLRVRAARAGGGKRTHDMQVTARYLKERAHGQFRNTSRSVKARDLEEHTHAQCRNTGRSVARAGSASGAGEHARPASEGARFGRAHARTVLETDGEGVRMHAGSTYDVLRARMTERKGGNSAASQHKQRQAARGQ